MINVRVGGGWDRNHCIVEAEKQLDYKNIYKILVEKEKLLLDLAKGSNNFS